MPSLIDIQFRRGTAAQWTAANPTLTAGEPAYETDTGKVKIGDGATAWAGLPYLSGGSGIGTLQSPGGSITITNPTGPTTSIDLPASGAAAGVYGDASHVAQVQVAADGIVTAVSSIAISGIAGAGFTTLFDQTLGADAAIIDTGANGIAQTSQHLLVILYLRTTVVAANTTTLVRLNGDSGANYDRVNITEQGTSITGSVAAGETSVGILAPGSSVASATLFGAAFLLIPSYRQTTGDKMMLTYAAQADTTTGNSIMQLRPTHWRSTAAINQISVAAANVKAGSRMTVFGLG